MLNSLIDYTNSSTHILGFMGLPMGMEWVVLLVLGLLIFGRRLPEVGRSLGKGIVEFKKGIRGIEDEIDEESSRSTGSPKRIPENSLRSELPNSESRSETLASKERSNEG